MKVDYHYYGPTERRQSFLWGLAVGLVLCGVAVIGALIESAPTGQIVKGA